MEEFLREYILEAEDYIDCYEGMSPVEFILDILYYLVETRVNP